MMVMPELKPLRRGPPGEGGPSHDQALCGRCQHLGHNCRQVLGGGGPPNDEADDDEDSYDRGDEREEVDDDEDHYDRGDEREEEYYEDAVDWYPDDRDDDEERDRDEDADYVD